jgi:hypothetical protein
MRISVVSTLLLATSAIAGRSPQHVNKKLPERMRREPAGLPAVGLDKRAATKKKHHIIPQNKNTTSMYQHSRRVSGSRLHIRRLRLWRSLGNHGSC